MFKRRVYAALHQSTNSSNKRGLGVRNKTILLGIPIALLLMGAGYGVYHSTTMTYPHTLTPEQLKNINKDVGSIQNQFGTFDRTKGKVQFPEGEIAHSEDKVNAQTKELITNYGVFVKESGEGQ